jgi:hypothetical protein
MERVWGVVEDGGVEGFEQWFIDWELIKGRGKGEMLTRLHDGLKMMREVKLWVLVRKGKP